MKTILLFVSLTTVLFLSACGSDSKKKPPKSNTPPIAIGVSVTTEAETLLNGKLEGSDADKDSLSFSASTQPQHGTLTIQSDGSFSYLPAMDFVGTDQFTFNVSDGKVVSANAIVNIKVDLLVVNMSAYTRQAFLQTENAEPLSLNSRSITQDVTDESAFDDLLTR